MPFTAHDLRYQPDQSYPMLYAYLHRNAQHFLGSLKYDAFEVDTVVGHVVEQLVRLGLLGGGDHTPLSALDGLSDAQFYAFLSRSVHNKAIDRLRKRHLNISSATELETPGREDGEEDILGDAVESLWGTRPFETPEEIAIHIVSQQTLLHILKHCILRLSVAPHQLRAVLQELEEYGADTLAESIAHELHLSPSEEGTESHISQHKDHAHKKLRFCLQQQSSNLTVRVALRLTEYIKLLKPARNTKEYVVDIQTLVQDDLPEEDVRTGLNALVAEGLLTWREEPKLTLSVEQARKLTRFYREE